VFVACKQQPNQITKGFVPRGDWKGTLVDLLPPPGDIKSFTINYEGTKAGGFDVTRELSDSERRLVQDSFANTRAISNRIPFQITGIATIVTRTGHTFRISMFGIESTDFVYLITEGPPERTPYFVQLGDTGRIFELLREPK
jgi:hypothetical protein